jgi:hypothetical protein
MWEMHSNLTEWGLWSFHTPEFNTSLGLLILVILFFFIFLEILNLIFNEKNAKAPFFTHQIGKSPEVYKPYVLSGCGKTGALFHHW